MADSGKGLLKLLNDGSLCYIYVTLQFLFHMHELMKEIPTKDGICSVMKYLYTLKWDSKIHERDGGDIIMAIMKDYEEQDHYRRGFQGDANQFLLATFSVLEKLKVNIKSVCGEFLFITRCHGCKKASRRNEQFLQIMINFPKESQSMTTKEAMLDIFKEDKLDGDNMYECEICERLQKGTRRSYITRWPRYLIFYINRVEDEQTGRKNTKILNFSHRMNFNIGERKKAHTYVLVSTIHHMGFNMNSGHYISNGCVKKNEWYTFDDGRVYRIPFTSIDKTNVCALLYMKL